MSNELTDQPAVLLHASRRWGRTVHGCTVSDSCIQRVQVGASAFKRFSSMDWVIVEVLSDFAANNSAGGLTILSRIIWRF